MKSFIQKGNSITCIAPTGGVISGLPVIIGAMCVVPATSAAATEAFEGVTTGVFSMPKVQADTPAQFAKAYLKADGTAVTTVATGNTLIGVFMEAGDGTQTEANIRLNGVSV